MMCLFAEPQLRKASRVDDKTLSYSDARMSDAELNLRLRTDAKKV